MHILVILSLAALATARPSFIAVPADQIAFLDLTRLHVRVPRQALSPPPLQSLPIYQQEYQPGPLPIQYQHQPLALAPQQEPQQRVVTLQQQPEASAPQHVPARLSERPPDFGEYVDFGAHTGDSGAFGWYADYPINNHDDHSGYRK